MSPRTIYMTGAASSMAAESVSIAHRSTMSRVRFLLWSTPRPTFSDSVVWIALPRPEMDQLSQTTPTALLWSVGRFLVLEFNYGRQVACHASGSWRYRISAVEDRANSIQSTDT
jgi:hypothetical protein